MKKNVYIVAAVRTPMGSFMGGLSTVPATKLGAIAIEGALKKGGVSADIVDEVFMGNVLQAGVGQAPARQAALGAGLGNNVPCTTVNKVCASGMKATMLGAQTILAGDNHIVVVGGMENMSLTPHYLDGRNGSKFGNIQMLDGITKDGLLDVYSKVPMGNCAELCAKEHNFSREDQDNFAITSYTRSAEAWKAGKFNDEIVPVSVPQRKGDPILFAEDEEYKKANFDKMGALKPAFVKEGAITAANASKINDGAAAVVLVAQNPPPPQQQQPTEIGAKISGSGAGLPPKFAVPDFIAPGGDAEAQAAAKLVGQVLWDDLNFEREFYLISRDTYRTIPQPPRWRSSRATRTTACAGRCRTGRQGQPEATQRPLQPWDHPAQSSAGGRGSRRRWCRAPHGRTPHTRAMPESQHSAPMRCGRDRGRQDYAQQGVSKAHVWPR